ncbi:FHA domain-containing protein [Streptomyces sp. NPDC020800]|uniref:FHA domain-containing protein n=1 Tax=Streptomyces sp. NPDC020800 TaxID=3365092 RepID=UPI0037941D3A
MGRDPQSDVVFQEATVSWWHARIHGDGTSWVLEDLNSTNGAYGLGRRIAPAEAGPGTVFRLGDGAEEPQIHFTGQPACPDGSDAVPVHPVPVRPSAHRADGTHRLVTHPNRATTDRCRLVPVDLCPIRSCVRPGDMSRWESCPAGSHLQEETWARRTTAGRPKG